MSYDIVYIVSHGFAARMITQTDLLGKLVQKGQSVGLIAPDKNDLNLKAYCQNAGVDLFEFDIRGKFSSEDYMFKRKYFLEDIETNPALMDKHIHAIRYNKSKHPIRRIRPYYYWLIYKLIEKFPSIRQKFKGKEKKYLKSGRAKELIEKLSPKKLVATYPVNYNEAVLLHYGNHNPVVETWIHLLSWDNITCKGIWPETADKYIAWGPIMKQELIAYYDVGDEKIFECGVPHFDIHYEVKNTPENKNYLADLGLDPLKPYLLFAMSSPRFAPHEIDIVEHLSDQIESGTFGDISLVIRPHPQNMTGTMRDKSWLPRLDRINEFSRVMVDYPILQEGGLKWSMQDVDMINFSKLIKGASLVLNSGSTVSIDALAHTKPVMITAFDGDFQLDYWKSARRLIDYPHIKKLVATKATTVTHSTQEMNHAINKYLHEPDWNAPEREFAWNQECASEGNATEGVVDIFLN